MAPMEGTHRGHQLGSGNLGLLSLGMWHIGVSLATVWASWLLMGCPKYWFLPPPTQPHPPHPTLPHRASHTPPLLSILTAEIDGKKYFEI